MDVNRSKLKIYRDRLVGAIAAICLIASIGHIIDWKGNQKSMEWQISLAFAAIGSILIFCSANRVKTLYYCFLAIVAFGILGAITGRTLAGLPIIVPSAMVVGAILLWKSEELK